VAWYPRKRVRTQILIIEIRARESKSDDSLKPVGEGRTFLTSQLLATTAVLFRYQPKVDCIASFLSFADR